MLFRSLRSYECLQADSLRVQADTIKVDLVQKEDELEVLIRRHQDVMDQRRSEKLLWKEQMNLFSVVPDFSTHACIILHLLSR